MARTASHSPAPSLSHSFGLHASASLCACVHVFMRIFVNVSMYCCAVCMVWVLVMLERGCCWCCCEMNGVGLCVRASKFGLNIADILDGSRRIESFHAISLLGTLMWQHVNVPVCVWVSAYVCSMLKLFRVIGIDDLALVSRSSNNQRQLNKRLHDTACNTHNMLHHHPLFLCTNSIAISVSLSRCSYLSPSLLVCLRLCSYVQNTVWLFAHVLRECVCNGCDSFGCLFPMHVHIRKSFFDKI